MYWLLHEDVLQQLRELHRRSAGVSADDQRGWMDAAEKEMADRGPRSLRVAGEVAEIRVEGILTKRPDFGAWLLGMGNTSYADVLEAIAVARSNTDVKAVQLFVDSPGGDADGLFDVFAALEQLRAEKPVRVRAANAYSAAYGIAAVAGPITATTAASMFGSVGVAVRYARWADVNVYDITNTESPDKRPDPATEAGQAVIRRELDAIFDLFAESIARGRSATTGEAVSRNDVAENFGRGASFTAKEAKRRQMVDTVPKSSPKTALALVSDEQPAATRGGEDEERTMTIEELRAKYPGLYQAAVDEGIAKGVAQERDRVEAHLTMAEMSGKPDPASGMHIALEAIRSGAEVTKALTARYVAVAMNRADRGTRQAETDEAGKVLEGVTPAPKVADLGDQVVAVIKQQGGL